MLQSTIMSMEHDLATVLSVHVFAADVVTTWTVLSIAVAVTLGLGIGLGCLLGYFLGLRQSRSADTNRVDAIAEKPISEIERIKMLELLHEIGSWTNEYNDKVSQYQGELGALKRIVDQGTGQVGSGRQVSGQRGAEQQASGASISVTSDRIVHLLQQFMQNSGQLQQRLDAAEFQLDQKTRQIVSYLNEARTDSLTGLFNRRAFDQRLEELFLNFRRGGRSFVVALVDVDHFKQVNDSHGHLIGDMALRAISKMLADGLSDTLMVARFGGEEFAVIMDGPLLEASQHMDRVRNELHTKGLCVDDIKLRTTISAGLSEPKDDTGAAPLVRRADEALYAAKNFGRNRVYFHDGGAPTLVGAPETARNS